MAVKEEDLRGINPLRLFLPHLPDLSQCWLLQQYSEQLSPYSTHSASLAPVPQQPKLVLHIRVADGMLRPKAGVTCPRSSLLGAMDVGAGGSRESWPERVSFTNMTLLQRKR